MLVDSSTRVPSDFVRFDVCIVGSGPAGITLAREISRSGLRVCLLESGGHKPAKKTQNLNAGGVDAGHGYREQILRDGRGRQFGGTANLWNHQVRGESARYVRYVPLDEIDFERRDWVPESGWPFSRREIQHFYERAQQVCGIGKFDYGAGAWEIGRNNNQPWQTEKIESVVSQFASSKIFLEYYRGELVRDERVTVILRATLLQLQMDHLSRAITSVQAATPDGRKFQVRAQAFVLAAGGLENARILLLQDALQPGGLGNQHDMVGRCFMDHPAITLGTLIPSSSAVFGQALFYDQHDVGGQAIMYKLHIRPDVIRREKMLNLCAFLVPHFKNLRGNGPAVLRQLLVRGPRFVWRYLSAEHRYSTQNAGKPPQPLRQRLLEGYYTERVCGWSRRSGLERRFGEFRVRSLVEQSPDRSNRIMLQEQTDVFGQRKIKVLWCWNELDLRSIRQAQQIFREELAAADIGTFTPLEDSVGSQPRRFDSPHHFLGTTRMHDNPRNGVVDADCRVHGVRNLFIAGSSVFPTGGFANPTLTIVSLALRLATYLQSELLSTPRVQAQPNTGTDSELNGSCSGYVADEVTTNIEERFAATAAVFTNLKLRVQQDTERAREEHPDRRLSWAPPLPFPAELSSVLEDFLIKHPPKKIFDSTYGRLWARWTESGKFVGWDLRAGREGSGEILTQVHVSRSVEGWWIGPDWIKPMSVEPWNQIEERVHARHQRLHPEMATDLVLQKALEYYRSRYETDVAKYNEHQTGYLSRALLRDLGLRAILAFADAPEAAIVSGAQLARICRRCYRVLTDPTSVELGIGPECRSS